MKKLFAVSMLLTGFISFCRGADLLPLAIATHEYPHMESIRNGSVQIPECRISYSTMSTADLNRNLDQGSAGDVIEVDLVPYLKRFAKEEKHDWVLIPVFLWREFPHHHVRVKGDKLAVDIPNDSILVWAKGILASSPTFKSTGSWDASAISLVSSLPPLFPDYRTAEQDYFKETRIFPIITALAIRAELVEANAWLPEALFIAFSEAKSKALDAGTVPLPWGVEHRDETVELMQKNYWSYGVKNNPKTLDAFFKYAYEQGITSKELTAEDLFSMETLQLIDEKGAKN